MEDDDDRRLWHPDLGLEHALARADSRSGVDQPAGTQRPGGLERERHRQAGERQPRDDDQKAVAGAPIAKALEAVHRRAVMLPVWYARQRP